jgi:effector-binding domain-containing protein
MKYETARVSGELIAAVRARVHLATIAQAFRGPLDQVWAFLRSHPGLRAGGHNLFLYHHEDVESGFVTVDFGVQVVRSFEQEGEVRCIETPSGEVVRACHRGPYDRLPGAHAGLRDWCWQHRRRIGSFSWEIYGDWNEDAEKLETTLVYLLEPSPATAQLRAANSSKRGL